MTLNEYQKRAMATCMKSCGNYSYMMGNLIAEVGELSGKIAKAQRKGLLTFEKDGQPAWNGSLADYQDFNIELAKEAGDILWQLSGLCEVMGWDLEVIAQMNLDKLASRQRRGKIDGEGDNR